MTIHQTIVCERLLDAAPAEVYVAYADAHERARWSAPSPAETVIYEESSFGVGGIDRYRCGAKANPEYRGVVTYLDIVRCERIVYAEQVSRGDTVLCAALITVELTPEGEATRVKITTQIVSFVGADMIKSVAAGTRAALENLAQWVLP